MQERLWKMSKKHIFSKHPIFKMKQTEDNKLLVHFPKLKQARFYNNELQQVENPVKFSQSFQAIQYFSLNQEIYAAAGLKNGKIQIVQISKSGQDSNLSIFKLNLSSQQGEDIYINDLLYLGNQRIMSIYNSGNCAIWDISQKQDISQPLYFMKKVHKKYFYKIRRVDQNHVVTSGQDGFTNIIDIQRGIVSQSYLNTGPVWCCNPFNQNLLCSGGLMDAIYFWDVRLNSMVQSTKIRFREVSCITNLNRNSIIFGDRKIITKCDLRMPVSLQYCRQNSMNVSAQSIIVSQFGGFAAGRGGDLCKFIETDQQVELQQKNIDLNVNQAPPNNWFNMIFDNLAQIRQFFGVNNRLGNQDLNDMAQFLAGNRLGQQQDSDSQDQQLDDDQQYFQQENIMDEQPYMQIEQQAEFLNLNVQLNNIDHNLNINNLVDTQNYTQVNIEQGNYDSQEDWQDVSSQQGAEYLQQQN